MKKDQLHDRWQRWVCATECQTFQHIIVSMHRMNLSISMMMMPEYVCASVYVMNSGAGVCAHLYIFADSVCTNWNGWREFQYIGQTTMARQPTVDYISIIISFWLQFLSIGWAPMPWNTLHRRKMAKSSKAKVNGKSTLLMRMDIMVE